MDDNRLAYLPELKFTVSRDENGCIVLSSQRDGELRTERRETAFDVISGWLDRQDEILEQWNKQQNNS